MVRASSHLFIQSSDWPLLLLCCFSLQAVQYAKAMGLRVLAIDAGEKEALCAELGAEAFIDFKTCKE